MKKKQILITGGTGFIGMSLAIELIGKGHKVFLYDINSHNILNSEYANNENLCFIQDDINHYEKLQSLFDEQQFEGIVHLAAVSRVVVAQNDPARCIQTNINGTQTLLQALRNASQNTPWLIFGSSREVYGESKTLPVCESFERKFVNIYGDSKIQGENLFTSFAKEHSNSCLILRFSNVYGNQYDIVDRVLPRFIRAIVKKQELIIEGGGQTIDFTHIDDTVDAIVLAMEYLRSNSNIIDNIHILPGIGKTLYEAIQYIEDITNIKAKVTTNPKRNYDVEKFIGNPSKMQTLLHTRPFKSLKQGLKLAIPKYAKVFQ